MTQAIQSVLNGALVKEIRLTMLANNIANINTIGFKEDKMYRIHEVLKSNPMEIFVQNASPESVRQSNIGSYTNFSQGKLIHTGNKLDFSLEGDGFFCVQEKDKVFYTRKGNLTTDDEGMLVTEDGLPVLGTGGKIYLDSRDVVVDEQGNIIEDGNVVDTIKIVRFERSNSLQKVGSTRFAKVDPDANEERIGDTEVLQGFIERSNVDAVNAMTEMIDVLRGYESYQKVIQSLHDTDMKTINDVGRLA